MACRYTYQGKTYSISEFDDVLKAMQPSEAAKYMPDVAAIPNAPFVGTTDAWVNLALKRVIKMAVDGGYEKVAFINGKQSADRYSLSKQVKSIDVNVLGDARSVYVKAIGGDGNVRMVADKSGKVTDGKYAGKGLDEVIGKEMANHIMGLTENTTIEGDGLEIGGTGMIAFYDKIIPNAVNTMLKKLGGGKMETVNMPKLIASHSPGERPAGNVVVAPNGNGFAVWDGPTGDLLKKGFETREDAEDWAKSNVGMLNQPGFSITPAMRKKAAGGMPLFSFAGRNAATADTHALGTAERRLVAGEDAETVRKETGWFKGADGKMRFEINDKDAKFSQDGLISGLQPISDNESEFGVVKLGDLLNHDSLFSAYPQLADAKVILAKEEPSDGTKAALKGNEIWIYNAYAIPMNMDGALSSLLHEIQHGIQTIEGFASGGSPDTVNAEKYKSKLEEKYQSEIDKLEKQLPKPNEKWIDGVHDEIEKKIASIEESKINIRNLDNSFGAYRNLSGEVEARNTQARQSLTDAQRREQSPESTADVKAADVIVVFNGKEMRSAPAPANAKVAPAQSATASPTTVAALQQAIQELVGSVLPNQLGRIVAATAADIKSTWIPVIGTGINLDSTDKAGKAQAFYVNNTIFLIADNIEAGTETAVLAHEMMHKWGKQVLGESGWNNLHSVIEGWSKAAAGTDERRVYDYAAEQVAAVGRELSNDELFPYAVEAAIRFGIKPNAIAKAGTVAKWLAQVKQALRDVWGKLTGKPELFNAQDLVNLAYGIAQREVGGVGTMSNRFTAPEVRNSEGKLLAPNNEESKLTEGQWHQVRSHEFLEFFGDWELAARADVSRIAQTFEQAKTKAAAFVGKPLTNRSTKLVAVVSNSSLSKMLSAKAVGKSESPSLHSFAVANADQLFERAEVAWQKPDDKGDKNIKAIHRFFTPVNVNGKMMLAKLTVKETADEATSNRLYSVESVEFNEKSPAAQWVAASAAADGIDLTSTRSARDVLSLAQRVQDFNPATVSKVVDENGEPLVVYHGTARSFSKFGKQGSKTKDPDSKSGFFFNANPKIADNFTWEKGSPFGGNIVPSYLSIDNPAVANFDLVGGRANLQQAAYFMDRSKLAGHDGAIFTTLSGSDQGITYVSFNPTQIKSATGNVGAYGQRPITESEAAPMGMTAAQANKAQGAGDIRFSRTHMAGQTTRQYTPEQMQAMRNTGAVIEVPTLKERAQALWQDAGKKIAQGIVDQFAPVKAIDGTAYALLRLSKGSSGAFEALLHGGQLKLTANVYDFDDANKGGVVERLLMPMQGEHHDFLRWVSGNRAEQLMPEDREHLFTQDDIDAYKTLADGTLAFDYTLQNGMRAGQSTRVRAEMYKDSLVTFNQFNKNVLDMAEQSGLIDGDSRQFWEHEFYVPFYRVSNDDDGGVRGMNIKSGVIRQQAFKRLKGGQSKLNHDLLDNTLMNWAHLLDASAKNRAAKATIEAAEAVGIALNGDQRTLEQMGSSVNNKNGVVWFMDEGKKRFSLIDNQGDGPYLMTAITALEYAGMRSPVMNAMGAMKHVLTVGVTASPFFKVRNLIRDSVSVIGLSGINVNPVANVAQGWKLTDPKSDSYFRLLAGGGTIHFGSMLDGNESKRLQALVESGVDASTILGDEHKVKAFYRKFIEPGITAYNELGNRGEAVNRASLYSQLISQGMNHAEASLQARDLMDFSMQGSFTTIRFLSQVVPFFNARLQGMYKLGRSAAEDPKRLAMVLGATSMFSLALLAAYSDDDDWKRREDWDRNNFWWFKFGGTAFRLPKPFELGAVATLAERGFELAFDNEMTGTAFRKQVMTLLSDNLSMNPIPQIVKPVLDVYANKDSFTGRPIETMSMERLRPEYRFTDRTSMAARGLSTAANSVTGIVGVSSPSPVQIDHMLRGYFGWLGSFVVGISDILAHPATGQPDHATPDYWKTITGSMVSDLRDAPSKYVSNMYDQARVIEQAYGTWRALQKQGDTEGAKEFREDNIDKLEKYRQVEAVKRTESKFNEQIRIIERSDKDSDEKRTLIRAIQQLKDQVAKRVAPI